jgi:ATP-independent RNA helicase DbpA
MPTDHNHSFSFSNLSLRQELLDNLVTLNYEQMTPIQAEALPVLLDNKDIIAQAKTGSGKTAAFSLTILNKLKVDHFCIQALILCPTRELAEQVAQSLRRYARLMHNVKVLNLSGGLSMRPQVDSLRHGAHIIVGTPGRVLKHLSEGNLSFTHLHTLVLDEADRMLDMGFFERPIRMQSNKSRDNLCKNLRKLLSGKYRKKWRLSSVFMKCKNHRINFLC